MARNCVIRHARLRRDLDRPQRDTCNLSTVTLKVPRVEELPGLWVDSNLGQQRRTLCRELSSDPDEKPIPRE
jgi:hypothetical protein